MHQTLDMICFSKTDSSTPLDDIKVNMSEHERVNMKGYKLVRGDDLSDNKKVVWISMSSDKCRFLVQFYREQSNF